MTAATARLTKESEFESLVRDADHERQIGRRADYWEGYVRGLRRAYHGVRFGSAYEHSLWVSLAGSEDAISRERGKGYLAGLAAFG